MDLSKVCDPYHAWSKWYPCPVLPAEQEERQCKICRRCETRRKETK